ncbi:MAG TPA: hypothetical protein VFS43_35390 [Polyangiaceae bacterium]|nr:hypothetical protein [Polyangiaceae bacterium]
MTPAPEPARPGRLAASKLHLRLVDVNRRTYRVASLRPGCGVAFSTNYYHQTWHVLSDPAGAAVLARLLWGLAFQRQPGTLVCIHGPHLRPTPFDADPSDPVVLVPTALTPVVNDDLRALRERLRRPSREGTRINWPSFGLDRALDDNRPAYQLSPAEHWKRFRGDDQLEVRHAGGCVVIAGPPDALRSAARSVHHMSRGGGDDGQGYLYLGRHQARYPDGEVQIFDRYHAMLSEAAEARRRTLESGDAPREKEALLWAIGLRRETICKERRASRPLADTTKP